MILEPITPSNLNDKKIKNIKKKKILIFSGSNLGCINMFGILYQLEYLNLFPQNDIGISFSSGCLVNLCFLLKTKEKTIQNCIYHLSTFFENQRFYHISIDNRILLFKKILNFFDCDENITFLKFKEKYNKICIFLCLDINTFKRFVFSHITTPNCKILDGFLASTTVPFFYKPFLYENYILFDPIYLKYNYITLLNNLNIHFKKKNILYINRGPTNINNLDIINYKCDECNIFKNYNFFKIHNYDDINIFLKNGYISTINYLKNI